MSQKLKYLPIYLGMIIFLTMTGAAWAQVPGETCENAIVVDALPFNDSGNTGDYGNEYSSIDVPEVASDAVTNGAGNDNYLNGNEVVYAYTASGNGTIDINTTNDNTWVGLWVFKGCPFNSTVGYHTGTTGASRQISELPVEIGETYYIVLSTWPSPDSIDYTISITGDVVVPVDCEEVSADDIDGPESICDGVDFTLTGTYIPETGVEYEWEQSTDNGETWEVVDGANRNYLTTNISENTDFRYTITCTISEESETSEVFSVAVKSADECYCIPTGAQNNSDEIVNFTLSNLSNDSDPSEGEDGYSDYSDTVEPAELNALASYTASLTSGGGSGSHGAAIWIDYNDDGVFDASEMVAWVDGIQLNSTVEFSEFVVENYPGTHKLRVQYHYNKNGQALEPCILTTPYGETEDYLVEITAAEECAGTPEIEDITGPDSICENIEFTLEIEEIVQSGIEYQWEESTDDGSTWTAIEGENDSQLTTSISEATSFRLKVTCTISDESAYSNELSITLNDVENCYCIPEGTNSNRYIDNFTTTNGVQNINNTNSGFSTGGYGDFTGDHIVEQEPGEEIEFDVDIEGGIAGFRIWVDWNGDGMFDDTEVVYSSSEYLSSQSGSFEVPVDAEPRTTRMRIASHWLSTTGDVDPCQTNFEYGEFEDYTFIVTGEEVECDAVTNVEVNEVTETTAVVSWDESTTAIDGYVVEVYEEDADITTDTPVFTETVTADVTSVDVEGLTPDTTYDVYIIADCGDDNITVSDVVTFTTEDIAGVGDYNTLELQVYPNPTATNLNISASEVIEEVQVYNLLGQLVMTVKPYAADVTIDVSKLNAATYLLNVNAEGTVNTVRFIKK